MRKGIIIIGVVLIIFTVPGYTISPDLITKEMNVLTGGNADTHLTSAMLAQMGIPPIDEMIKVTQYSIIGLGIVGIGCIFMGAFSKKSKSQFATSRTESTYHEEKDEEKKENALNTLQQRLAKGKITSSQYQNLKRILEEDDKKSTK